ncbi:nuclear transport factor 2 family protein [soil metagenome]
MIAAMPKHLLPVLLAAATIVPAAALAAPPAAHDAAAMRKTVDDSAVAWNRGDLNGFMESYEHSPATVMVGSKGLMHGWDTLRDHYQQAYGGKKGFGALSFSDFEATALGRDYAVLYGRYHLMRPDATKEDTGVFDLVMHKTPKGWRILSDHTS